MVSLVRERAPAKLNLGLEILARRPNGYHEIQTVFAPIELFDDLELELAGEPGIQLTVTGADLPLDASNLAVRAAEATARALAFEAGLALRLTKRIPVAAGLGGGSSDAAAAIRGVEALAGRRLPDGERAALALQLGADVPFFLDPRPSLGRGLGELLEPLPGVPEMWWVLVAMPFPVSTAEAYREASRELTLPKPGSSIAALLGPGGLRASPRNDLEAFTGRRHPEIAAAQKALQAAGAGVTGMSGSGPTVYGSFRDRTSAERAAGSLEFPAAERVLAVRSPSSDDLARSSASERWGVAKR
jgi:4-diphosphocytidyl-2-C-methyl-D-erythritol kinase